MIVYLSVTVWILNSLQRRRRRRTIFFISILLLRSLSYNYFFFPPPVVIHLDSPRLADRNARFSGGRRKTVVRYTRTDSDEQTPTRIAREGKNQSPLRCTAMDARNGRIITKSGAHPSNFHAIVSVYHACQG